MLGRLGTTNVECKSGGRNTTLRVKYAKRADLRLFMTLASRMASSVKSNWDDMADCHSASRAMESVLKDNGFADVKVIGCSVIIGNQEGLNSRTGEFTPTDSAAHSVVLVSGCLIDVTAGQFRSPEVRIPDYLVLSERIVTPMLQCNRHWMMTQSGGLNTHSVDSDVSNFSVAYIPTDPHFTLS